MPFLNGVFIPPDHYPAALAAAPKVTDIEAIAPELIAQIYSEGWTQGFTAGALEFLDERARLDSEKHFAEALAN